VQSTRSDILRLAESDFIRWLRAGLLQIPHPTSTPADKIDVLVQVPVKYVRFVDKGQALVVLIDEVVGVSKLTPDLTREFNARLRNLGEAWLPISYHSEWLSELVKTTNIPVELASGKAVPSLDGSGETAAVKKEGALDLPDTTGQDQRLSCGSDDGGEHRIVSPASEEQPIVAHTLDDALAIQPLNSPPVQASEGSSSPHTTVEEQVNPDGVSASKGRKRSSVAKTDKGGTTDNRAKQAQSSLLPAPNGCAGDRQGQSEDVHD
jgi:hypothetical protein